MHILRSTTLLAVVVALFALQDAPIPRHKPDGNPDHDGQPEWCQNYRDKMSQPNCDCQPHGDDAEECDARKNDDENDMPSRCSTYCRRPACHCQSGCTT